MFCFMNRLFLKSGILAWFDFSLTLKSRDYVVILLKKNGPCHFRHKRNVTSKSSAMFWHHHSSGREPSCWRVAH